MLNTFLLSLRQLGDRAILAVFARSIAVTLIVLAALGAGLWWAMHALVGWWGLGQGATTLAGALAAVAALLLSWLLFRVIAIAVIGIFADDVVEAVEHRHYPDAANQATPLRLRTGIMMGLASAGRALVVNLAASPVYVGLLVTGVGTAAAFFVVNGWLLGRDLGDMVAVRHMPAAAMRDWRATTRVRRFALGLVVTGLLVVPVVNLAGPVIGAAMATHLFHRKARA